MEDSSKTDNGIEQFLSNKEEQPEAPQPSTPEPQNNAGPRAPWVPMATSLRVIRFLTIATIALTISVILLTAISVSQFNRKPWIVGYANGKYSETEPQRFRVTRDDVELFLGDVIPKIYGSVKGEAAALDLLRTTVNPNIISVQKQNLLDQKPMLTSQGISQFAIVTGINPDTLVINRTQKIVYAEATGLVMMTRQDKSTPSEVQWRCLLYIVDPLSSEQSNTPGGRVAGNQYGLYLQQIVEQAPGTVNTDNPQPTTQDEQERREQELLKQKAALPTIQLPETPALNQ